MDTRIVGAGHAFLSNNNQWASVRMDGEFTPAQLRGLADYREARAGFEAAKG